MVKSEYEKARYRLIPIAEKVANEAVGMRPKSLKVKTEWGYKWNKVYLSEMDRLAREAKLI